MQRLMSTLWGKILIGIVGLLVICCVFGAIVGPQSKQTGANSAARAPTAAAAERTAAPAATAAPEATEADQVEASQATAAPEATAVPTNTPEPTRDLAVATYAQQAGKYTSQIGQGLAQIGKLSQSPQFGDTNWMIDMAAAIVMVQDGHKQLQAIQPPASMQGVHAALLDATGDCNEAMTHLTKGIDAVSESELRTASTLMRSCGNKTSAVTQQLRAQAQ